jgi:RTX calcium-binding nonapeptide repeat (4 copies)
MTVHRVHLKSGHVTAAVVLGLGLCVLHPASSPAATNNIYTLAGTGTAGFSGDGAVANAAQLNAPTGVAVAPDGAILITDQANNRVRRVSPTGIIATVAGSGTAGFRGDGRDAVAAQLNFPASVPVTADGGYLIADQENHRVRRVSAAGTITTVAGTGTGPPDGGFGGDGGRATSAQLNTPTSVAPTADGGYLIADSGNNRMRRVSAAGTISTVAGTGTAGGAGDGGPATDAQLDAPTGVATTSDGGFLIAESMFTNTDDVGRVRQVTPDGTITTVAGGDVDPAQTTLGDGGPAVQALVGIPTWVTPLADGGFLIVDAECAMVRRVSLKGRITSVAGSLTTVDGQESCNPGFGGDNGPATAAQLNTPTSVALTADGGFLIADADNNRVRYVDAGLGAPPRAATTGPDALVGTPGRDLICGLRGSDRINGRGGDDALFGDRCAGEPSNPRPGRAADGDGHDRLRGGPGRDRLYGSRGRDTLAGGLGRDILEGGRGQDRLSGGPGPDTLNVRDGKRDRVDCGPGRDRVRADRRDRLARCERPR